jgi:hypothetical protein
MRALIEKTTLVTICTALALSACDKTDAGATATNKPAAPAATQTSNQPAATPAAAPAPAASKCPAGTKGVGTQIDPCEAKGAKRFIELTYAGKDDEGASQFTMKNVSDKPIGNASFYTFFYDKAGTQLAKDGQKAYVGRAGSLRSPLAPGQSATVALEPSKAEWPEGTATIEAEAVMLSFGDGVWMKNMDLMPSDRPKGGVK